MAKKAHDHKNIAGPTRDQQILAEKSQLKLVIAISVNWLIYTRSFYTDRSALSLEQYTAWTLVHLLGFKLIIETHRLGKIIFLGNSLLYMEIFLAT